MFAQAQQYEFVRDGRGFRMVETAISIPIVPPDNRPLWKRMLYSFRPWAAAAPHSRINWNEQLNLYELNGAIGVGIQGKVEY